MRNLFHPESKFMQALTMTGDFIILNLLYLICCIPIVTIGAANSALHRVMFDMQEDKGYIYRKFFKCLYHDFKAATPLFLLKNAVTIFLIYDLGLILEAQDALPVNATFLFCAVLLFLVLWLGAFSSMGAQVAMFRSTFKQYMLNGIYIALTHLGKAFLVALMEVFPIVFYLVDPIMFMVFGPLWLFLYFSVTTSLTVKLWKKPFDYYIEQAEKEK